MNIVSFSGGKDSTAMLLMMIEEKIPFDEVVFFDTGWEFPAMLEHIKEVEKKTGISITKLKSPKPFDYWMLERKIVGRIGKNKGICYRKGYGWPSPMRRWCTRIKVDTINKYLKGKNSVIHIGYASDELHRIDHVSADKYKRKFPLIDMQITEKDALKICYDAGFTFGGLYEKFNRVSCYCCPLQSIWALRRVRADFPDLWKEMIRKDKTIEDNIGFRGYDTVQDLEEQFSKEDKQMRLF